MADKKELDRALKELQHMTGLPITVTALTPEEIANTMAGLKQLTSAYKEKYNHIYFLQQLLLGDISFSDIQGRAKKLHLDTDVKRVLFLIETKTSFDEPALEVLKQLFPTPSKNHVIPMNDHTIAVLRLVKAKEASDDIAEISHMIVDTLNAEAMTHVRLTYSTAIDSLCSLSDVYNETCLTLQINKLFYPEQIIFPTNRLGIGRLIYKLPSSICEDFLQEIFGDESPDTFDQEITTTINKFFQNNLNIAETSRQLHVHRNTLIYRLEQLAKRTGLDIRTFEDALTFKIATMVMNYTRTKKEN